MKVNLRFATRDKFNRLHSVGEHLPTHWPTIPSSFSGQVSGKRVAIILLKIACLASNWFSLKSGYTIVLQEEFTGHPIRCSRGNCSRKFLAPPHPLLRGGGDIFWTLLPSFAPGGNFLDPASILCSGGGGHFLDPPAILCSRGELSGLSFHPLLQGEFSGSSWHGRKYNLWPMTPEVTTNSMAELPAPNDPPTSFSLAQKSFIWITGKS